MANVYLEARSNDGSKQASTQLCVVSNYADQLLGTFRNRKEATEWARAMGYVPLVPRSGHPKDKRNPEHWQAAE